MNLKILTQGEITNCNVWLPNIQVMRTNFSNKILAKMIKKYGSQRLSDHNFEYHTDLNFPQDDLTWIVLNKKSENINWKFCIHSVQTTFPKYNKLIQRLDSILVLFPHCEWQKASEDYFSEVIKNCYGHLTMSFISCYNAAYFGVTSLTSI